MALEQTNQGGWERFKEQARLATFEGRIEQLERICRSTPGVLPNRAADPRPPKHSRAWYAEEILFAIRAARHHLAHGQASHAASEAVVIGFLAAEAEASHNWPAVRQWNDLRLRNQVSARKRGRDLSEAAQHRARAIQDAADKYRRQHPYHPRTNSTRSMARDLAHRLGQKYNTVRDHLRKLGIR